MKIGIKSGNEKGFSAVIVLILILLISTLFIVSKYVRPGQEKDSQEKIESRSDIRLEVDFGENFVLTLGDKAHVKNTDIYIEITKFYNGGCPAGLACFWSGYAVGHTVTIGDEIYENGAGISKNWLDMPYNVFVKDTDYESYAEFMIETVESTCIREKEGSCWLNLAKRFKDPNFCERISSENLRLKDICYEEVAGLLDDQTLCDKVEDRNMYCGYVDVVKAGNEAECKKIITLRHTYKCFTQIAKNKGMGIEICDGVSEYDAYYCRAAFDPSQNNYENN